jgi:glucose/arabinose dehydrogenase
MRGSTWIMISAAALAMVGCSPKPSAPPVAPIPPAPAAPPLPAASAPTPESPPAAPVTPEATAAPAPAAAPAPPPSVHFSPADYPARERRIAALINNAESRDTSGETQYVAEQGRAQRQRCTTRACIESSYAAEEVRLRKWEGSSDIK